MINLILDQVQLVFILTLVGLPISSLLVPCAQKKMHLIFLTAPLAGISLAIFLSTVIMGFGGNLSTSLWACLFVWFLCILSQYKLLKKILYSTNIFEYRVQILTGVLVSILILMIPNLFLHQDEIVKFRLGIDAALYVDAAQRLLDVNNIYKLESPLSIAAFNVHYRWGIPIVLAIFSKILLIKNIYDVIPIFLGIILFYNGLVIFLVLSVFKEIKFNNSILISMVFVLNVNILNTLMEAQWAHTLSIVFFTTIIYLWLEIRKSDIAQNRWYLMITLIFIPLTVIYSEIIPVLFMFFIFASVFDFFISKDKFFINAKVVLCLLLSIVLLYPYSKLVLVHLFNLNIKAAGYGLPLWLFPNELFGIGNIYHRYVEWMAPEASMLRLIRRDWWYSIITSLIIIYCIYKSILKCNISSKSVYLTVVLLYLLGIFKFGFIDHSNYSFTKLSLTLMPFLFVPLVVWLVNDPKKEIYFYLYSILVALFGHQYLVDFSRSSYPMTSNTLEMAKFFANGNNRCSILFRKTGINRDAEKWVDRTLDYAMIPLFPRNFLIDQQSTTPYGFGIASEDYLNSKVCIVLDKNQIHDWPLYLSGNDIAFSNSQWLVILTNDVVKGVDNKYFETYKNTKK